MMSVRSRCLSYWCVLAVAVALQSGCAIGGKSFSMDSNSRIPFFGLELKERKPKSTAPVYRSIARTSETSTDVKVALQISQATGTSAKRRDDQPRPLSFSGIDLSNPPLPAGSQKWAAEISKADDVAIESIPLPRTDTPSQSVERLTAHRDVDFQ